MPARYLGLSALALLLAATSAEAKSAGEVARGEYLITRLAMCADCHSPRDAQGRPVPGGPLIGAPFKGGPPNDPNFSHYAPALAGLPAGRTAAEVSHLLQTGAYPDGRTLHEPMPQFRWNKADAGAGAAYLASLKKP